MLLFFVLVRQPTRATRTYTLLPDRVVFRSPRDQARGKIGGPEGAGDPQAGTPYAIDVNAGWRLPFTGMLCKQPPYGGIRAIDIATGKTIWDRPLGTARTNGPFGEVFPTRAFPSTDFTRAGLFAGDEISIADGRLILSPP